MSRGTGCRACVRKAAANSVHGCSSIARFVYLGYLHQIAVPLRLVLDVVVDFDLDLVLLKGVQDHVHAEVQVHVQIMMQAPTFSSLTGCATRRVGESSENTRGLRSH